MDRKSKIEQILYRFENCELQSNEELSASLYYAYCSLPIYDSSEIELKVKKSNSINFKSIKCDSWEIDLAENLAHIFRCVVSIKEILDTENSVKPRKVYTFEFVGVEEDSSIACDIYNKLYYAMIYKCKSAFKRSLDKVFLKRNLISTVGGKKSGINPQANTELKSLVEDISDLSSCLRRNEFSDLISKHFLRENQRLLS